MHFRIAAPEGDVRDRVLLLSSPLIHSFHWRKIVPELTQMGCLVVLVDMPGFGRSDCGAYVPQSNALRAKLIWGILDYIDEQGGTPASTWHLMGHGSACAAILEMGALYPDSVKSQAHICPLFSTRLSPKAPPPERWFDDTAFDPDNFRRMVEHYCGYPLDDFILDRMRAPLTRPGARESFLRMVRSGDQPPECGVDFCPAMVITGGRDPMMLSHVRQEIDRLTQGAETHTLQSAGHFPMETHSKALRDYLRGWIRYNSEI